MASTNEKGIIFFNLFELSPQSATIFLWCFPSIFVLALIIGILFIYRRFQDDLEIIINNNYMSDPKSLVNPQIIKVNFAEVTELYVQTINKNKSLVITHSKGKLLIPSMVLQDEDTFNQLVALVTTKTNAGKTFFK